jgi:hypothetical protein
MKPIGFISLTLKLLSGKINVNGIERFSSLQYLLFPNKFGVPRMNSSALISLGSPKIIDSLEWVASEFQ